MVRGGGLGSRSHLSFWFGFEMNKRLDAVYLNVNKRQR